MTKSFINNLMSEMCKKSSHLWSEWSMNDNICAKTRKCRRCGNEETQEVEHSWGKSEIVETECARIRVCTHCGEKEVTKGEWYFHTWGEWKLTKDHNCGNHSVARECQYCHEIDVSETQYYRGSFDHTWEEWKAGIEKCKKERICQVCGKKETSVEHTWEDRVIHSEKCRYYKKCQFCGEVEYFYQHAWGNWEFRNLICAELRECLNCGETEYSNRRNPSKDVSHEYKLVNKTLHETKKTGGGDDWEDIYKCEFKCNRCGDIQVQIRDDYRGYEW